MSPAGISSRHPRSDRTSIPRQAPLRHRPKQNKNQPCVQVLHTLQKGIKRLHFPQDLVPGTRAGPRDTQPSRRSFHREPSHGDPPRASNTDTGRQRVRRWRRSLARYAADHENLLAGRSVETDANAPNVRPGQRLPSEQGREQTPTAVGHHVRSTRATGPLTQ